ncbi:MAG: hypothetical protein ACI4QS_01010 [Comamonas sp.]
MPRLEPPAPDTASIKDSMRHVESLIPSYFIRYLAYTVGFGSLVFIAGSLIQHFALPDWPVDRKEWEGLLQLNSFLLAALGMSATLVGIIVTLHIAQAALSIANSAKVLTQLDYEREAQKASNELYTELMAVNRSITHTLQRTQQMPTILTLPRHWQLLYLWQLDKLERHGEVWGASPEEVNLNDSFRAELLQHVADYLEHPSSQRLTDSDRAALLRLQAQLPLHSSDTTIDVWQALEDCGDTEAALAAIAQMREVVQQWQQALVAIETSPFVFGIYRQQADTLQAFARLRDHCDNLLGCLGSEHRGDRNDAVQMLVRAQLLWLAYLRHDTMGFLATHKIAPFVCLLAQQSFAVEATFYARAPGAHGMAHALHTLLQPLQLSETQLRQLGKIPSLEALHATPDAHESAMAYLPRVIEEALHDLAWLDHTLPEAHRSYRPMFDRINPDGPDHVIVETGLQRWRQLTLCALHDQPLPSSEATEAAA